VLTKSVIYAIPLHCDWIYVNLLINLRLNVLRKAFMHKESEDEKGEMSANAVIRREYQKLGAVR
jgi:hypothetical protein